MDGGNTDRRVPFRTLLGILCGCASLLCASGADAASLHLSPPSGWYGIGRSFDVVLYVDSEGRAVNAVEGVLSFDPELLQVQSVTSPDSIFNLNVQDAEYSNTDGTVHWTGVILNPGYTGTSGNMLTVTFRGVGKGTAEVSYAAAQVLANDGEGTDILTSTSGGSYTVGPGWVVPETIITNAGRAFWMTALAWLIGLAALSLLLFLLWRALRRRWFPVLAKRRDRNEDLRARIGHLIEDTQQELELLTRVAKHRPLYPEEKYLKSKFALYKRQLQALIPGVRRVAKND